MNVDNYFFKSPLKHYCNDSSKLIDNNIILNDHSASTPPMPLIEWKYISHASQGQATLNPKHMAHEVHSHPLYSQMMLQSGSVCKESWWNRRKDL